MSSTIGLASAPLASQAVLPTLVANQGKDVQGTSVQADANLGTVPQNETGGYTPAAIAAPSVPHEPDKTGFYFHDMLHREAGGLPVIPLAHYAAGSGGYQASCNTCHETTAQLLRDLQKTVPPRETALQVFRALPQALRLPLDQTYEGTKRFIANHPFFREGVMDLPIGGGKHGRNIPFIGPGRIIFGLVTLNRTEIAKGVETTRGTWDAD